MDTPILKPLPEYVGTGYLCVDGTLILRLRREEEGCRFDDELSYAPTNPYYESICKYIGPVKPNSVFSLRSFKAQ